MMRYNGELYPMEYPSLSADETQDFIVAQAPRHPSNSKSSWIARISTLPMRSRRWTECVASAPTATTSAWAWTGVSFRAIANQIPTLKKELGVPEGIGKNGRPPPGPGAQGDWPDRALARPARWQPLSTSSTGPSPAHIIAIEDPIEHIHPPKRSLINQRQVGMHTRSFSAALRAALREDPDVIMVGEMRDLETISTAITAAETGHLVLGTLHTSSAAKTIDRMIGAFPSGQQAQIRTMVSESLRGVCSQLLIPSTTPGKRVPAIEVLIGCVPIANVIRDAKTYQIPSLMQTGRHLGMRSMDEALLELMQKKLIAVQDAYDFATDKKLFEVRAN